MSSTAINLGYTKTIHDLIDIVMPLAPNPAILLTPRVVAPLHHQNPRNILTQIDRGWWDRVRQQVYQSQNFHCACCGVHKAYQLSPRKQLDAHELYDVDYETGTVKLLAIVPLCKVCHNAIHFGRLTAQYEAGKLSERDYYAVLGHANRIIAAAGLPTKDWDPNKNDNTYNIPWDKWHLDLVINGELKSFYSLYKDQADLEAHY